MLDEADRMFEMGFETQVRSIIKSVRPDRQTLLFSATFKRRIEALARDTLTNPVRISVRRGDYALLTVVACLGSLCVASGWHLRPDERECEAGGVGVS